MDRDFILFSTENKGQYLYDTNTNTVHPLPYDVNEEWVRKIYDTPASELISLPDEEISRYFNIWRSHTDAFQRRKPVLRRPITDMENARKEHFSSGLACDLILIVTEQCNMRCAYCVYEEDLYDNRRNHNSKFMDIDTAHKAIDLYLKTNQQEIYKPFARRAMNIVFYGGEPLLNWPVVSDAIVYAREKYDGEFPLYIGMTTNLTLLKPEWLPFLRDNDIFINVSLDGPEKEQNRYRHFADGSPTFKKVYDNLKMIRDFDSEYFEKYIKAMVTCNGNTDFIEVADFFDLDANSPSIQNVSMLKDLEDGRFHMQYPYDKKQRQDSQRALISRYEQALRDKQPMVCGSALYKLMYEAQSNDFHKPHRLSGQSEWYTGSCLPGRKIVVGADGMMYPCERIAMDYPTGHVDSGLDEERLLKYFNSFLASTDECGECWARRRCTLCPAAADSIAELQFENKCDKIRRAVMEALIAEYSQLEKTPDMFTGEYAYY